MLDEDTIVEKIQFIHEGKTYTLGRTDQVTGGIYVYGILNSKGEVEFWEGSWFNFIIKWKFNRMKKRITKGDMITCS